MNAYLPISIEFGAEVVRRLLPLLPADALDTRLDPERFTPREVIAHLADWEPIMRERIVTALQTPGASLTAFDEGQMAVDHNYAGTDPAEQVEIFVRERKLTAELIRSVRGADWDKTVVHPERGPQSVADLGNLLLGHDLYHIEQLTEHLGFPG